MKNIFAPLGHFFAKLGKLVGKGIQAAVDAGLTDELLRLTLSLVRQANDKYVDPAEKREFVVKFLKEKGVPEYIARIAVELAYRMFKKNVQDRYGV